MTLLLTAPVYSTRPLRKRKAMAYKDVNEYQYTAGSSNLSTMTITALIGCEIVSIEKEIKPLLTSEYTFNSSSGTITLASGVTLDKNETLFILYKKLVTT